MLQLKYGRSKPSIRVPGTLAALDALREAGCLSDDDHGHFSVSYRYLRSVEARIRLMNSAARHEMPEDRMELRKLAFLLGHSRVESLLRETKRFTSENRRRFERIIAEAASEPA